MAKRTYEQFCESYLNDMHVLDDSDKYRKYYARIRSNIRTNPDYVRFVKNELDVSNINDAVIYLMHSNWEEESEFPMELCKGSIENYVKYAHKLAMSKLCYVRIAMVKRINKVIIDMQRNFIQPTKKLIK